MNMDHMAQYLTILSTDIVLLKLRSRSILFLTLTVLTEIHETLGTM